MKDAILKEVRGCVNTWNEYRCRQISHYIQSFWKDLHVKNGCFCVDDRIAIPNTIKDACFEAIHATHPGSLGVTDMAVQATWPFMHRDLLSKTAKCNPCVKTGETSNPQNSIKPSSKWAPLKLCKVPNEEVDQLGITFSQKPCPKIEENAIETPRVLKQPLVKKIPELISRIAKSKQHTVNSKFHQNYLAIHQK